MRVLIDLTSLDDNYTGIERYAKEISLSMISQFYEHKYILVFKNEIAAGFDDVIKQSNVEYRILKMPVKGAIGKLLSNQVVLPLQLYKIKADAYLFLAFPEPWLFFNSRIYTAIHDVAAIDAADTMTTISKWYFRLSYFHAALFARRIITVSKFSAVRINKTLRKSKKKLWIIRDGVSAFKKSSQDRREIFKKYNLPKKYWLSLATLEPRKNLPLLLWAYDELLAENSNIPDLVLAGRKGWKVDKLLDGYSDALRNKTHVTGFIEEQDMAYIYENASLFITASSYEGFGLPPLEAMSMGIQVLSSDIPAAREVLGDAAMYFKSDSVNDLKAKLNIMLTLKPDERAECIYKGRCRAKRYSWNDEARKLMQRLERMK